MPNSMLQTRQDLQGYGFAGALVELAARQTNEQAQTVSMTTRIHFSWFK
jgi:hypothetical protein